ncbi:MAG: haloacid dehalogenase-like hydrolase, partial [Solobacterium sp.]|nr:haloacid dehalogenase-like hydrolase [Solobacterium sp.]
MNVYDFDNTIYRGDSTADLILFLWTHYPKTLLNLPRTAVLGLLYGIRVIPKMTFKQNVYHMFVYIKDIDAVVEEFIRT